MTCMRIPGLRLTPGLFAGDALKALTQAAIALDHRIEDQSNISSKVVSYISKQHNLPSQESFQKVELPEGGRTIRADYFPRYGEDGLRLTYFREDVPAFVRDLLIPRIEELEEVRALKSTELKWKFTLNAYRCSTTNPKVRAGLGFHVDTPTNGDVSVIVTLLSQGKMKMRSCKDPSDELSLELPIGSSLELGRVARWDWEHCVLPQEIPGLFPNAIHRMSLVLGCKVLNVKELFYGCGC